MNIIKILFTCVISFNFLLLGSCSKDINNNGVVNTLGSTPNLIETSINNTNNKQENIEESSNKEIEEFIPNHPGDKGQYYLMKSEINNGIIKALHKRVGVDSIGYSKTEINCKTKQVRDLGYSEESSLNISENPGEWYDVVDGSSKSYLFNFLCNKYSN